MEVADGVKKVDVMKIIYSTSDLVAIECDMLCLLDNVCHESQLNRAENPKKSKGGAV